MERKRVYTACDRCRLKKSKCDGDSPCSRCQTNNAICVFGKRRKSNNKVYTKGYAELLEHQQACLIRGLQELYWRSTEGRIFPRNLLESGPNGRPLTHDLLTLLIPLDHADSDNSEETLNSFQQDYSCRKAGKRLNEVWEEGAKDAPPSVSSEDIRDHSIPCTSLTYSPIMCQPDIDAKSQVSANLPPTKWTTAVQQGSSREFQPNPQQESANAQLSTLIEVDLMTMDDFAFWSLWD